jgi:hypothetical protein
LVCHAYRFPIPRASEYAYSYLLGLYLGDGHITSGPRDVHRLRIYLDRAYPLIVAQCEAAIGILAPENQVSVVHSAHSSMDIPGAFSRHWPCLFPQHGPGAKHSRPIVLEPWQREIVDLYPWRFLALMDRYIGPKR